MTLCSQDRDGGRLATLRFVESQPQDPIMVSRRVLGAQALCSVENEPCSRWRLGVLGRTLVGHVEDQPQDPINLALFSRRVLWTQALVEGVRRLEPRYGHLALGLFLSLVSFRWDLLLCGGDQPQDPINLEADTMSRVGLILFDPPEIRTSDVIESNWPLT